MEENINLAQQIIKEHNKMRDNHNHFDDQKNQQEHQFTRENPNLGQSHSDEPPVTDSTSPSAEQHQPQSLQWQQKQPNKIAFDELVVHGSITTQFVNNHPQSEYIFAQPNWNLKSLQVDDLIISNDAESFEKIQAQLRFPDDVVRSSNDKDAKVVVNELTLDGHLNGHNFNAFVQNTLKINEPEQEIDASVDVHTLNVTGLHTQHVSGVNVANIIRINVGSFAIHQDIQFTKPVTANNLYVMERLNHINVINNTLDVLLRRSPNLQVLQTPQTFDSMMLLEPIILRGSIKSISLDNMKPIVTINQDIVLEGDYQIAGHVTVSKLLQATDLMGQSGNYSVRRLQNDGVSLRQTEINMPIQFLREIEVGDLLSPSYINGLDITSLVKTNTPETQRISAKKIFTGDLFIRNGSCEAAMINGINLDQLNRTILKRSAKDQIVTGTIHFDKIIVDR